MLIARWFTHLEKAQFSPSGGRESESVDIDRKPRNTYLSSCLYPMRANSASSAATPLPWLASAEIDSSLIVKSGAVKRSRRAKPKVVSHRITDEVSHVHAWHAIRLGNPFGAYLESKTGARVAIKTHQEWPDKYM